MARGKPGTGPTYGSPEWKKAKQRRRDQRIAEGRERRYPGKTRQRRKASLKAKCEICGDTYRLCWDHDHATGKPRGTLCSRCNTGLGMFRDDANFLRRAIEYLALSAGLGHAPYA